MHTVSFLICFFIFTQIAGSWAYCTNDPLEFVLFFSNNYQHLWNLPLDIDKIRNLDPSQYPKTFKDCQCKFESAFQMLLRNQSLGEKNETYLMKLFNTCYLKVYINTMHRDNRSLFEYGGTYNTSEVEQFLVDNYDAKRKTEW